jgi:hypothetical protein
MPQRRREVNEKGQFFCPDCSTWKEGFEFYKNKRTLDGISTYCKPCHSARQREQYSPAAKQRKYDEREEEAQKELLERLEAYRSGTTDISTLEMGETATITFEGRWYRVQRVLGPRAADADVPKVDYEDWTAQRSGARVLGVPIAEPATPTVPTEEYVGGEYQPVRLGPPPEDGLDNLAAVQRGRALDWSKKDEWSSQDQADYDAYEAWENRRFEEKYGRSDD